MKGVNCDIICMVAKNGWMDGCLEFNGILNTQVAVISCMREFKYAKNTNVKHYEYTNIYSNNTM